MNKILIQLIVLSMISCALSLVYANESAVVKMKTVYIKGKLGSGSGEVGELIQNDYSVLPTAIEINLKGNIYIADHVNKRIQKYDSGGKYLQTIKIDAVEKNEVIIVDIASDVECDLLVAIQDEMRISKYSESGKYLKSIYLADKKLRWDDKEGWMNGFVQIERLFTDNFGNIYLQGRNELIEFSDNGSIRAKWAPIEYVRAAVLDGLGNLYITKKNTLNIEKYDSSGKLLETQRCGGAISRVDRTYCVLPSFIDRNGYLYWFEQNKGQVTNAVKGIKVIKAKQMNGGHIDDFMIQDFNVYGNTVKFDAQGNLYLLNSSKKEFWIEKYSWDNNNAD